MSEEAKDEDEVIYGRIYKIYKIDEPEKFYIGSTIKTLAERLSDHQNKSKNLDDNRIFYKAVREGDGWDNFQIELIQDYLCFNRDELRMKEDEYIRELKPCYNEMRAYLSEEERKDFQKEYQEKHKEEIAKYKKEYNKEYRERHKEKITKYRKEYYEKNKK